MTLCEEERVGHSSSIESVLQDASTAISEHTKAEFPSCIAKRSSLCSLSSQDSGCSRDDMIHQILFMQNNLMELKAKSAALKERNEELKNTRQVMNEYVAVIANKV